MMTIHLSKVWDKDHLQFFLQFSGTLSPRINANWKVQQIRTEFASYGPKVTSAEERTAEIEAADLPIKIMPVEHDIVSFDRRTHEVRFSHEKTTKFLERIVVQKQEQSQSQ